MNLTTLSLLQGAVLVRICDCIAEPPTSPAARLVLTTSMLLGWLLGKWIHRKYRQHAARKKIPAATGAELETLASVYGLRRTIETDEELRQRLVRHVIFS